MKQSVMKQERDSRFIPRVITLTSGKGGVGKTNITLNLGLALAELGKRILVLDADLGLANINVLMGLEPTATIEQFLAEKATAEKILVRYRENLHIIPASSGVQQLTHLEAEQCNRLAQCLEELGRGYDYLLVDTGAGIGDNVTFFCAAADDVIIVVNHEPTSITDAYALIKVLANVHHQKAFSILVNRVPAGGNGRDTYAKLAAVATRFLHVSLRFLGALPEDSWVSESVIKQQPYLVVAPSSKISIETCKFAEKLAVTEWNKSPKGGLQFFFQQVVEQHKGIVQA